MPRGRGVVSILLYLIQCVHNYSRLCTSGCHCPYVSIGANASIRNNEKQLPYDLSAKNPEAGRLLMVRGETAHLASLLTKLYTV